MKRSAPKSSGLPDPVLFLDENLASPRIYRSLEDAGLTVLTFNSLLSRGASDVEVLMVASEMGVVLVTGDQDFRYHAAVRAAFPNSRARVLVLASSKNMRAKEIATLIIRARKKIARFVAEHPPPAMGKIDSLGKIVPISLRRR